MTDLVRLEELARGLSRPQRELLLELPAMASDIYAPARKLVSLGLAQWVPYRFSDRLEPTELGSAVRQSLNTGASS